MQPETHSNIQALLKLLSTLPLTSCDAERTFSALKRLKTVGRSTKGEGRHEGILMEIHKRTYVDAAAVAKCISRRETPAPAKSETARGRLSDMLVGSRADPAWRNRPLQAEREGADVCTYL